MLIGRRCLRCRWHGTQRLTIPYLAEPQGLVASGGIPDSVGYSLGARMLSVKLSNVVKVEGSLAAGSASRFRSRCCCARTRLFGDGARCLQVWLCEYSAGSTQMGGSKTLLRQV